MEGGCDEQVYSGRKEGYIYHKHYWRLPLVTTYVNLFSQAVFIKATASVNVTFALAVVL
jgi:hypothetical protein